MGDGRLYSCVAVEPAYNPGGCATGGASAIDDTRTMTHTSSPRPQLDRMQRGAVVVGAAGLLLCLAGVFVNPSQFFQSYLFAYLFWVGMALGCLAILMLHHLVGGGWGVVIRRLLEAAAMTLPLMAVLFVPLLFGLHDLYLWARPAEVASDANLQH